MSKKIAEMAGAELDKWVMLALGWEHCGAIGVSEPNKDGVPWCRSERNDWWKTPDGEFICGDCYCLPYPFSTDWSQGGPIIEREHIHLESNFEDEWSAGFMIEDSEGEPHWKWIHGDTPLIAAMRAFVASVYGEEVPDGEA